MKCFVVLIIIILSVCSCAQPQTLIQSTEAEIEGKNVLYQIDIYVQAADYMSDLFQKFSEGYIEADPALKKVMVLHHEYNKLAKPVPVEVKGLYRLMNKLLSNIEEYFIYFKKANRENPEINIKISEVRYEIYKELVKLRYEYM